MTSSYVVYQAHLTRLEDLHREAAATRRARLASEAARRPKNPIKGQPDDDRHVALRTASRRA